MQLNIDITHKV